MNDEDFTGPSRLGWQLIGLAVLLVVIVVYGIAPWLAAPYDSGVRTVEHLTINGAQVTIYPPGTVCRGPRGEVLQVKHLQTRTGLDVVSIPENAVCGLRP